MLLVIITYTQYRYVVTNIDQWISVIGTYYIINLYVIFSAAVMAQRLLQMLGVWHGTQHEKLQRI